MKFIKFQLFFILSLLGSISTYSDNLFYVSKSDINNPQANYSNNLSNDDDLYHKDYLDSVNNDCESIKYSNLIKYAICKINKLLAHKKAIGDIKDLANSVSKSLKEPITGNLLRNNHNISSDLCKQYSLTLPAGTKVNWELHGPNEHAHYDCPKTEGHWHYRILNKIPNTNKCKANKSGRYYVCGSDKPAEYNTYWWYLDEY